MVVQTNLFKSFVKLEKKQMQFGVSMDKKTGYWRN